MPDSKPCALCGGNAPLRTSHILPAFLFRWLRDTGGTPFIRNTKNPNIRVQDGLKVPMLCHDCETLFSRYETEFSKRVFYPLQEDDALTIRYDEWFLRFCVSVSWRILQYCYDTTEMKDFTDSQLEYVGKALERWAGFLRGEHPHPGIHEQHFLPWGPIESHSIPDMPNNANRFLLRAMYVDIASSQSCVMTFAKMGPMMLFGYVQPPREKWHGTKVHVRDGKIGPGEYKLPRGIFDYLRDKMLEVKAANGHVSDKQWTIIDQTVMRNIDRFAGSKQLEAMRHDERLFGTDAVIRKRR